MARRGARTKAFDRLSAEIRLVKDELSLTYADVVDILEDLKTEQEVRDTFKHLKPKT